MKRSAGVLLFRRRNHETEVFLVHPGGPFWAKKDEGAWSIPKGEYSDGEDPLDAAKREFQEETGSSVDGKFIALGEVKQAGGKLVWAWALEQDIDASQIESNTFEMKWPPGSRKLKSFPEVDRASWFPLSIARTKLLNSQVPFLERLASNINTI